MCINYIKKFVITAGSIVCMVTIRSTIEFSVCGVVTTNDCYCKSILYKERAYFAHSLFVCVWRCLMVWMTLLQYFNLCVNSYSCHKRMDLDIIFSLNCMCWVKLNLHTLIILLCTACTCTVLYQGP